jgi:hypothetical protein
LENLLGKYEVVLIPLDYRITTENDFRRLYGLDSDKFARMVVDNGDRIKVVIGTEPPGYPDFYASIFRKFARQGLTPAHPALRVSIFLRTLVLARHAVVEGISSEENWRMEMSEKHKEYDLESCIDEARKLPRQGADYVARMFNVGNEAALDFLGYALVQLRLLGLDDLVKISLKIWAEQPEVGADCLMAYHEYMVKPIALSLGGWRNCSVEDIRSMLFLRVPVSVTDSVQLNEILRLSPSCASMISSQPMESVIHIEPFADPQKIIDFSKDHAKQYFEEMRLFKAKSYEGDLSGASEALGRARESMVNQYNIEYQQLVGKEKLLKVPLNVGVTFFSGLDYVLKLLTVAADSLPPEWRWLPRFATVFGLPEGIKKKLERIDPKDMTEKWQMKENPFMMTGLPFVLWRHDIRL